MISAAALLAWSALSVGLAVTPGADTALVATNAARGGVGAGLRAMAGIVCGGAVYTALFGFGVLRVIAATPVLFMIVKTVGAIYLAYLGVQLLRSALKKSSPLVGEVSRASATEGGRADTRAFDRPPPLAPPHKGAGNPSSPWRQGFLCNVLNPKVALFFLAALPQFVQAGPEAPLVGALLIAISYAIGAVWLSGIAFAASRVSDVFRASPIARWVEGAVGAAFLAFAGRLAVERA